MVSPLFSILMPTHNRPDTIEYAIRSVLAQTESSFELLVVGDGASPATAEIVAGFDDPRVRWFSYPKAPHFGYANRNRALRDSSGDLIAFASDDDLMFPDHLSLMRGLFEEPATMLAYGQAIWVSTDGICGPDLTNLFFPEERRQYMARGNWLAAGSIAYRASAFPRRDVWPEDIDAGGDWEIWRRLISIKGFESVRYLRTPVCLHFSTPRKGARDSLNSRLAGYIRAAESHIWYPHPLRVAIPPGASEQSVFWQIISLDPLEWARVIREAAVDCVNRLALDRLQWLLEPDPAIERDLLRAELAELHGSRSWRITAPLRSLSAWFATRA